MSEVFREVSFTCNGTEYTITPSMALLRRIKAAGVNNMDLAQRCLRGGADALDLVTVHRAFMADAGAPIGDDQSYLWLTSGNVSELTSFQTAYVQSVLPGVDIGKKPAAPAPNRATRKPKAKT